MVDFCLHMGTNEFGPHTLNPSPKWSRTGQLSIKIKQWSKDGPNPSTQALIKDFKNDNKL